MPSAQLACGLTEMRDACAGAAAWGALERGAGVVPPHAKRSEPAVSAATRPGMIAMELWEDLGERDLRGTSSRGWLETATLSKLGRF
jgi:hypothetical protein